MQNKTFLTVRQFAHEREKAITIALNKYFQGESWDESLISNDMEIIYDQYGYEKLSINNILVIEFGPIVTQTTITDGKVTCKFQQSIKVY